MNATTNNVIQPPSETANRRPHLGFLDGIRGLAALYVVIHHTVLTILDSSDYRAAWSPSSSHALNSVLSRVQLYFTAHGEWAVAVFIVLSGYCLGLPVAINNNKLKDVKTFIYRRARRILPSYYAALAIGIALIVAIPGMQNPVDGWLKASLPAIAPGPILTHIFLVHNLTSWSLRIDPPMWSVAIEWQIYFVFAFVVAPVWSRLGTRWAFACTTILGLGSAMAFPRSSFSHPYLWLFGLGMLGAAISHGDLQKKYSLSINWKWLSIGFFAILYCLTLTKQTRFQHISLVHSIHVATGGLTWPFDGLMGISAAALIVYFATRPPNESRKGSLLRRILESKPVVLLGSFSYSLYLFHTLVIWLFEILTVRLKLSFQYEAAIMLFVSLPVALLTSYAFHLIFEKPYMTSPAKQ